MFAPLLVLLALAGQPATPDDGPVQTAPKERSISDDPLPGLDDKTVTIADPPPRAAEPVAPKAAPAAVAAAKSLTVEQKTMVLGDTLQIVLGQRALFRLDDKGQPVLDKVEDGQLAAAHPNQTDKAIDYRAIALVMNQGKVTPTPAPVCNVASGAVRTETWRRPVVAVGLGRFKPIETIKDCK